MDQDIRQRSSWRPEEFAFKHSLCRAKIYQEISSGRLPAKKVGRSTIITEEGERIWLASLPAYSEREPAAEPAAPAEPGIVHVFD